MNKQSFRLEAVRLFESKVFRDAIHGYIHVEYLPIWSVYGLPVG